MGLVREQRQSLAWQFPTHCVQETLLHSFFISCICFLQMCVLSCWHPVSSSDKHDSSQGPLWRSREYPIPQGQIFPRSLVSWLQELCLMMRWSNLLLGTTHCNDTTLSQWYSVYWEHKSTTRISQLCGTGNKRQRETLTLAYSFSLYLLSKANEFLFHKFSFYRSCKKSVKCDWRYYLALWPVVKHQLSWRVLLLLSEERLVCKFLSNPYYAYLLVL